MDRAWIGRGSGVDRAWIGRGSGVDRAWIKRGSNVDQTWIERGSDVDRAWIGRGSGVDQAWIRRGSRVDRTWIGRGLGVDQTWIRRGSGVDRMWIGRGSDVDQAWIGRGSGVDQTWIGSHKRRRTMFDEYLRIHARYKSNIRSKLYDILIVTADSIEDPGIAYSDDTSTVLYDIRARTYNTTMLECTLRVLYAICVGCTKHGTSSSISKQHTSRNPSTMGFQE